MVEYTGAGKLVLMLGLVIGTCAITAWTAVFSSAMVNYLANEAEEDYLAKAASHRMLVAIEVVMRLQQQWRRRKRRREAAIARGEPPVNDLERQALGFRTKVRRLLFRQGALGKALIFVFQVTLVVNIVANLLHSLPEFRESKQVEPVRWRVEAVCDLIFLVELILYLIAGKGRQGVRWVFGRTVDMVCLVPGLVALWHMVNRIQKLEDLDMELLGSSEVFKSNDTTDFQMLLDTLQMIRVVRILFWHQWQRKVHVVLSGIAQTGPILVIPAIMSSLIWIMTSALFVWMENVYNGPSKDFFTSVPTSMYWTSSFLIGEWTLADFSPGGGNRVYDKSKSIPKESPRFDEVSTTATPRDGGEFRTPGPTPRVDGVKLSAREVPPPAVEEDKRDEISYEGTYLGTMKHGRGRLRMRTYTYEGEFQNDMKHGLGALEWDDGRRYEGGFRNGKFHGAAVMQWPDGRRYVGQYAEDRKHGDGTFSWQDGRRYEGQWVAGKRHGIGTYTNAKGFTRRGTWQQDRPIKWEEPDPQASGLSLQSPTRQPERLEAEEEVIEVSTL
ncbi:unnamed protein product [Effrenium voratum]|nr:unnamed protein product [Effrenium voratum]